MGSLTHDLARSLALLVVRRICLRSLKFNPKPGKCFQKPPNTSPNPQTCHQQWCLGASEAPLLLLDPSKIDFGWIVGRVGLHCGCQNQTTNYEKYDLFFDHIFGCMFDGFGMDSAAMFEDVFEEKSVWKRKRRTCENIHPSQAKP